MQAYTYSPLPERYIRLLTVVPNTDPPSGFLTQVALDEAEDFDALSYTWGEVNKTYTFICDGKVLLVHKNLHDFLRRISTKDDRESRHPLWIDAICIDQSNGVEKGHQIPFMSQIYSRTASLLIWWGPNSAVEDDAFAMIPAVSSTMQTFARPECTWPEWTDEECAAVGIPPRSSPFWGSLGEIFDRPWLSRLWVVQEVSLAKFESTKVLCGTVTLAWRDVVFFEAGISHHRLSDFLKIPHWKSEDFVAVKEDEMTGILGLYYTQCVLPRCIESDLFDISRMIRLMRSKRTSKPVDRVYGVLGLLPPEIRKAITVNTNFSVTEVYFDFARAAVQAGYGIVLLNNVSSAKQLEGFVSWCPNFDSNIAAYLLSTTAESCGYQASYEEQPTGTDYSICLIPNSNIIRALGLRIDKVSEIVQGNYDIRSTKESIEWEAACLHLTCRVFKFEESGNVPEAYWRTLIANSTFGFQKDSTTWHKCDTDLQDVYQRWKANRNVERLPGDPGPMLDESIGSFMGSTQRACTHRQFFATSGGRIGLGPIDTKVGDSVCVLYGGPVPFIIREHSDDRLCYLIGEAYVHGLMAGEAIKMRDHEGLSNTHFYIG
jgi:hypothetical protein